jgi:uncharacterized membrane protein
MKRAVLSFDAISLVSMAGVAAYTASVYGSLPERIATHFDLHGTPNGWMDRAWGTWALQGFGLVLWAALRLSAYWLPTSSGWRERAHKSPMAAVAMLSALLLGAIGTFVVWNALHPEASRGVILSALLGAYSIALSVVMPRIRRNPLVGVRTSFTMSSDENWARTHRVASYAFAVAGLASLACAAAGLPAAGIVAFIACAAIPLLYSWVVQYRLPPET